MRRLLLAVGTALAVVAGGAALDEALKRATAAGAHPAD
jgi:hypothetical protein